MLSDPVADLVDDQIHADLARLREDWGSFEVAEKHHRIPESEHHPEAVGDGVFRYASTWIRRDGEVLMVRPGDDDGWTGPGGTHEPGESFAETARREAREEAGVDCRLTGILEAIVTVVEPEGHDPESALGVIFEADHVSGTPRPEPGEIDDVGWFAEIPDEEDLVFPRVADYPL